MEPLNLPESVRSLLSERIDRLAGPEKDVLQAASVIGQSTTLRLLESVARTPDTAAICARLQEAGFLEPVDAPEPTFVFHHALMSDAAYAGLLHQRRETMHARVVDAIEELYGDRIAEHVETLVELDRDYRRLADNSGVPGYYRVPAVGTDPRFIAALAELVEAAR